MSADTLRLVKRAHRAAYGRVFVTPGDYVRIIGATFVKHEHQPLLTIGTHHWDRWALGRLGCPHPVAAANINRVLQQLQITSLAELAARIHEVGTFKGMGHTAYWTCLAILREGGWEPEAVHQVDVSFSALKARAMKAEQQAEPAKRRKRRRA
jgi:hypothetical protein